MAKTNLTLSIDKDLLDKARVLAAIRRTSVNEMVRGFLAAEIDREQAQALRNSGFVSNIKSSHEPGR